MTLQPTLYYKACRQRAGTKKRVRPKWPNPTRRPGSLNTRSVHGSLVASHRAVNILMEKDRLKRIRRACHVHLSAGPVEMVISGLEDLWLESDPHVPGPSGGDPGCDAT